MKAEIMLSFSMKVRLFALSLCLVVATASASLDPVVRITTSLGAVDVQLLPGSAPNTVANFLRYVDRSPNGYNGTFIHRLAPGFVVQGGGYITSTFMNMNGNFSATHIPTDPPVANEFSLSNIRGTLAMAKLGGNPDSATSEWFFNLADNSANLDTTNGGFTVFGRVIGNGLSVVDAIAALPRVTMGEGVPLRNYTSGTTVTQANLVNINMARLTGPRTDFNNDGKFDILWQNSATGQRSIWLMNGTVRASSVNLPAVATEWNIVGSGDFNRDGNSDILWQNGLTGQRSIWLMNRTSRTSSVNLGFVSTDWNIVGSGDFNRDGKADILWQNNSTGQRTVWLFNGTVHTNSVPLPTVSAAWNIVATGDFNGDVKPDLLWQNSSTGQRLIWLLDGTVHTSTVNLPAVAAAWNIVGAGDFNGDLKSDILWQNSSTGQRLIWLMNGTVRTSSVNLPTVSTQWHIRNR
jgi:cyclophilin family peptidyl-prolyl cis-trans isomerase